MEWKPRMRNHRFLGLIFSLFPYHMVIDMGSNWTVKTLWEARTVGSNYHWKSYIIGYRKILIYLGRGEAG